MAHTEGFESVNQLVSAGPVLLEDYHLLEKLAQFDRERIPEVQYLLLSH